MASKTLRPGIPLKAPAATRVPLPTPPVGAILGKVSLRKEAYKLKADRYGDDRLKIVAVDNEGDEFETITASVPNNAMATDEFAVRCHHSTFELVLAVGALRLFEDTGRKVKLGTVELMVWRLKPPTK